MTARELLDRCQNYLASGGLWNPEAMEHDKVRDLIRDVRDHLHAVLKDDAAPREPVPEPVACWWTRDGDSDTWATGCGNLFTINDSDTPSDAGMKFCLYCGKPVDDSAHEADR